MLYILAVVLATPAAIASFTCASWLVMEWEDRDQFKLWYWIISAPSLAVFTVAFGPFVALAWALDRLIKKGTK